MDQVLEIILIIGITILCGLGIDGVIRYAIEVFKNK